MRYLSLFFTLLFVTTKSLLAIQTYPSWVESLQSATEKLDAYPFYVYPCEGIEEQLDRDQASSLLIFSYGSLMSEESASRTLSHDTLKTYRLALAFGLKRVFDRDVPVKPESRWGTPRNSIARGMLNVHPSPYLEQCVNGILIEVPKDELRTLIRREEGYNFIPVVVIDWQRWLQGDLKWEIAYTFQAPQKSLWTHPEILPRPHYYELVRDAAMTHGPLFGLLWYQTTFLADGTPVFQWEERVRQEEESTLTNPLPEEADSGI